MKTFNITAIYHGEFEQSFHSVADGFCTAYKRMDKEKVVSIIKGTSIRLGGRSLEFTFGRFPPRAFKSFKPNHTYQVKVTSTDKPWTAEQLSKVYLCMSRLGLCFQGNIPLRSHRVPASAEKEEEETVEESKEKEEEKEPAPTVTFAPA